MCLEKAGVRGEMITWQTNPRGRLRGGYLYQESEKLQNHSNEGKRKEKKEERGEGKEEKKKKAMVALLVFIIAGFKTKTVQ